MNGDFVSDDSPSSIVDSPVGIPTTRILKYRPASDRYGARR